MARPQRLTDVEFLIETHTYLVEQVLNFHHSKFWKMDRGELISAGMLGLWEAAEVYQRNKNHQAVFKGFASVVIYNKMVDVMRKEYGRGRTGSFGIRSISPISLNQTGDVEYETEELLYVLPAKPIDTIGRMILLEWMKSFKSLRERTILFFSVFMGWSTKEIADWCGVSEVTIRKQTKEIARKSEEVRKVKDERLSDKQLVIFRMVADGYESDEIAKRLHMAKDTVKGHRKQIIRKLNAKSPIHAVTLGFRSGILE